MMNFKKKAVFTGILALAALVMVLATGCRSLLPAGSNNNADPAVDLMLGSVVGAEKGAENEGISVTGQGSVTLKPDVAVISLGVEKTDADAAKARKANDEAMEKVLKAIKAFGVADDDITTTNFNIYPVYDDKGQKITGYRVYNTVSVKVKNLDKLGAVLTAATDAGANTSYGVSFDILDRTAAYNEALGQAMAKARARAELMAKALGVQLGRALTINESSNYSGPTYAMPEAAMEDYAKSMDVPVSSGQMDVTASVSVLYEIVK